MIESRYYGSGDETTHTQRYEKRKRKRTYYVQPIYIFFNSSVNILEQL